MLEKFPLEYTCSNKYLKSYSYSDKIQTCSKFGDEESLFSTEGKVPNVIGRCSLNARRVISSTIHNQHASKKHRAVDS